MATAHGRPEQKILRDLTRRVLWLGATILFMIAVGLTTAGIATYKPTGSDLLSVITLALGVNFLTGAVGAALVDILIRQPQEEQQPRLASHSDVARVQAGVDSNTESIDSLATSLTEISGFITQHAKTALLLEQASVAEVFAKRSHAAAAMLDAVRNLDRHEIRIMGTTLSDFVGAPHGSAWEILQAYLHDPAPAQGSAEELTVKILVCDPKSLSAHLLDLRSPSDGHSPDHSQVDGDYQSQLQADFDRVFARIRPIVGQSAARPGGPRLEFRICREFLPAFLLAAGGTVFVQPQIFYKYDDLEQPELPVLKYELGSTISTALVQQFDVLWAHASAPPDRFVEGKPVRIAGGAARTGVVELYTDAGPASEQLGRLLRSARHRILMQGISNIPIMRGDLSDAFAVAASRPNVRIRVMLLDPRSETAMQKSFARYQSTGNQAAAAGWPAYRQNEPRRGGPHESSDIYSNIRTSLAWFMRQAQEANRRDPHKLHVRLCSSIDAFMLVADDCVLFEPYHFGDEYNVDFPSQTPLQLAGNMPLIEFHTPHPDPFPPRLGNNVSSPLEVCVSHFNRVFEQFSVEVPSELSD